MRGVRVVVLGSPGDVSVPDVSVPDVGGGGGAFGSLMSVVIGGLVLVTVPVVVVADPDEGVRLPEVVVSVKYCCAGPGASESRTSAETRKYTTAMTATAPTLAARSVEVRSCHAGSVTGTDSSRDLAVRGGSDQLADDLGGKEVKVVEIGHVESLQIHPLHTRVDERTETVHDLTRRARQR